jgi:hypothetical protein
VVLISASAKVRDQPHSPAELDRQLGEAVAKPPPLTAILAEQRGSGLPSGTDNTWSDRTLWG